MIKKERMISEFCELVGIDSVTYQESEMATCLKRKLVELGFQVEQDDAGDKIGGTCGNLYGYLPGTAPKEPLLFSAHMDTVAPGLGKKAILHEDGRITSDGTTVLGADDVAGIVSILEAIRSVKEEKKEHRPLEVLFTVAEEIFTAGCKEFDQKKLKSKEAYILDMSGKVGTAACQAPSILTFEAEVIGKAAHAGFAPEAGVHAIGIAGKIISKMKLGRIDEQTTVNIGTIAGGKAFNIVPAECKVVGEVRGFDHEHAMKQLHEIKALFEEEIRIQGAKLNWKESVSCIAYQIDGETRVPQRYQEVCKGLGIESKFVKTFGGSDCNVLVRGGIDGMVIANAMNCVHSCEEYTEAEELVRSAQIVEQLVLHEY